MLAAIVQDSGLNRHIPRPFTRARKPDRPQTAITQLNNRGRMDGFAWHTGDKLRLKIGRGTKPWRLRLGQSLRGRYRKSSLRRAVENFVSRRSKSDNEQPHKQGAAADVSHVRSPHLNN